MRAVGDRGVDLDAPVHRSRVHDDGVGLGAGELLRRQAVGLEEFLGRGQQRPFHALVLQAQHHHDVAACEPLEHVVMHGDAELLHAFGQERAGADDAHVGRAERGERMDQRARHARVQHVPHDRDREAAEVLLVVADGVDVEQTLRRMRVAPVAGVDHVHVGGDVARDQVGGAA